MAAPPKAPIWIFDNTITQVGVVSLYEEAFFTQEHYEVGQFQIKINKNAPFASLFDYDLIVRFGTDNKKAGIITSIQDSFDEGGKGSEIRLISGVQLKGWFSRRWIVRPGGSANYTDSNPAETVIKNLIKTQSTTAVDTNRRWSVLNVTTDSGRGTTYPISVSYVNLLETLKLIAKGSAMGWSANLNPATQKIDIDVVPGTDRTSGNVNSFTLNPDFGNTRSGTITKSDDNYRNFIYALGAGSGTTQTVVGAYIAGGVPSSYDRIETAAQFSSYLDDTGSYLTNAGKAALSAMQLTTTLDAQALVSAPQVFGIDYFLGDLVTTKVLGVLQNRRITGIKESWANLDYQLELTFDIPIPTQSQQISQTIQTINNSLNNTGNTAPSGTVPTSRTISTTSPLSGGGDLSADRTIVIQNADASHAGALTSTDWSTFNNKAPAFGALSSWTPTISSASGAITSYTINSAKYFQNGKVILGTIDFTITNNGSGATAVLFSLPVTNGSYRWRFSGQDLLNTGFLLVGGVNSAGTTARITNYDNTYPGGTGWQLTMAFLYYID